MTIDDDDPSSSRLESNQDTPDESTTDGIASSSETDEASDSGEFLGSWRSQLKKRKRPSEDVGSRRHGAQREGRRGRPSRNLEKITDASGDEGEGLEPEYLRKRRTKLETAQASRQAGLRIPPEYSEVDFSDDERLHKLHERPDFADRNPIGPYKDRELPVSAGTIPASIAQWLREYQVEGAAFLHRLFVYQNGGILGDDMGLGKTIQVITFLTAAFGKSGDERDAKRMRKMRRAGAKWYPRVLLVCPGSLIKNWQDELQRWGWWQCAVCHGSSKDEAIDAAASGRLEIMITTYATYRGYKDLINSVAWDCVIADECQIIKGKKSETTQALNEVNALCRIGLTGTAIQNDYQELWTLLNWTNPGRFGKSATWKKTISEPLKLGQSHDATAHELGLARKTAQALVAKVLPQFFLRRMKSLIADQLPKKFDRVVFCPLTETQTQAYERLLESDAIRTITDAFERCSCGSEKKAGWCCEKEGRGGESWRALVFPGIMNLQKLCNHLATLIPQAGDAQDKQEKDLQTLQSAMPDQWRELYRSAGAMSTYADSEYCGKWKVLKKLLRFWHNAGDKVLVFSRSVRLLRMLHALFQNTAYRVSYLDGSLPYEERAQVVDDFNENRDQFVFLISTRAGGVGLNIVSASKVVIVDPDWNPATDLQAQDRAYRIGQARDVEVVRLVSAGTIEEIVYARQIYKQQQANIGYTASRERRYFRGVQSRGDRKGEIFGLDNLFAPVGEQVVLRDIVHRTNVAESRAGVAVVDFDTAAAAGDDSQAGDHEGGDDSDVAKLAALVTSGNANGKTGPEKAPDPEKNARSNPIEAILAGAGVAYTHENAQTIGSSTVEARLSRHAANARGLGPDVGAAPIFGREAASEGQPAYRYRPPEAVARRQFCTMARDMGYADATAFALDVEAWTQAQRRECLERFYERRRDELGLERTDERAEASV